MSAKCIQLDLSPQINNGWDHKWKGLMNMTKNMTKHNLLASETVHMYEENGFVQVDDVLDAQDISDLKEYMEEAMSTKGDRSLHTDKHKGNYYKVLNQKVNVWRDHGGIAQFSFHPKLAQMAMELSKAKGIQLFHDHALWKMPQDSKPTPWHQDFPYWPMNENGALSIWIPLDDVDEQNGCMMFVPGSHKAGKLRGIDLVNPENILDQIRGTEIETTKPIKVPLKAGSCTFHHGLTFHYAHSNQTEHPRRVLALIYMPVGTTYNGKPHAVTDGLNLVKNEPIRGGLFPVLTRS